MVYPHVTAGRKGRGRVHATLSIRICPKATRGKVAVVVHAIVVVQCAGGTMPDLMCVRGRVRVRCTGGFLLGVEV